MSSASQSPRFLLPQSFSFLPLSTTAFLKRAALTKESKFSGQIYRSLQYAGALFEKLGHSS